MESQECCHLATYSLISLAFLSQDPGTKGVGGPGTLGIFSRLSRSLPPFTAGETEAGEDRTSLLREALSSHASPRGHDGSPEEAQLPGRGLSGRYPVELTGGGARNHWPAFRPCLPRAAGRISKYHLVPVGSLETGGVRQPHRRRQQEVSSDPR